MLQAKVSSVLAKRGEFKLSQEAEAEEEEGEGIG
jgi:hypothetical protein